MFKIPPLFFKSSCYFCRMIQRIQTLYLLGIIAVIAFLVLANSGISSGSGLQNNLKANYTLGIKTADIQPSQVSTSFNYGIVSSLMLSLLLSAITIFQFKNLSLQKRLCMFNFGLISVACIFIWYAHFSITNSSGILWETHFSYGSILAFLPLLLNYFALRGIRKDIATLASADRLR